ncbi:MAG TPA: hypothetical protein ENG03_08140 [Thioploca sp.]|nr:MAG: hypothetical protein B6247_16130 [Beggiatoa sp. 4572_84]RKZ46700.1 MAG: hypothetical protein DRR08_33090 [Gammaproteobacteria bacterium]HDN27047.1 hypothetical protein [Thioploca sp.]
MSKYSNSKRQFGIEIEFLLPRWEELDPIAVTSPKLGLSLWIDPQEIPDWGTERPYNEVSDWKLTTDSSVENGDGSVGFEINSRILQGESSLSELAIILEHLNKYNALVDEQCGLHVHIEIRNNFSETQIKNLLKLQLNLEDAFDSLINPERRRGNIYCKSNLNPFYSELCEGSTISVDPAIWTDTSRASLVSRSFQFLDEAEQQTMQMMAAGSMFHKMNCGTVEIRSHHGTLDYAEIVNWIALQMALVETAYSASQIEPETLFFVGTQKAFTVLEANLNENVIQYYLNR